MIESHIHRKTGEPYQLLFLTNEETESDKFIPTAVYLDKNGRLWSRPCVEFVERFDRIDEVSANTRRN